MGKVRSTSRRSGADTTTTAFDGFTAGVKVEVSSDDEGFRDAWYEAVVLRRIITSSQQHLVVQYSSLLCDADPSRHLQESVSFSHVRPRPPRAHRSRLALHVQVEGFHNDGWWPGVVAAVHRHRRGYAVCFPGTREVVELRSSEVRPRLEWVGGQWLPPGDQGEEAMFAVGELVEVTRDRENYGAAWFPAMIKKVIGKAYFLVEYENASSTKTEIVDEQYVRPTPLNSGEPKNLDLLHKVEAFCKDRWSAGMVSRIFSGSKYAVKFKYPEDGDELDFDRCQLRPQREWINGQWVDASEQVECSESDIADETQLIGHKRKLEVGNRPALPFSVPDSSDSDDKVSNEEDSDLIISSLKKCRHSSKVQSLLSKKLNKGESVVELDCTALEVESGPFIVEKRCHSKSHSKSHSKERNAANSLVDSTLALISCPGELVFEHSKHKLNEVTRQLSKHKLNEVTQQLPKIGEPYMSHDEVLKLQSRNPIPDHPPFVDGTNNMLLATAWGNNKCVRTAVKNWPRRKKLVARRATKNQRKSPETAGKRRRGRPRKSTIVHSQEMGLRQMQLSGPSYEREDGREDMELSGPNLSGLNQHEVQPLCNGNEVMRHEGQPVCLLNEAMRDELSPQYVDTVGDPPEGTIVSIKMVDRQLKGLPACNASDSMHVKRQLEFCNGGKASVNYSANDNTSNAVLSCSNITVEEVCNDLNEATGEADGQVPLSSPNDDSVIMHEESTPTGTSSKKSLVQTEGASAALSPNCSSMKKIGLPFEKDSPVWESIELMEVFHVMPQDPHFHPLGQYCEPFREGMAIGLMVTFANLVGGIRKLRICDPDVVFEEKLKALVPLEANGFEVGHARSRIKELLDIKSNQTQCMGRKSELQREILDRNNEKDRLDALAGAIDKAIMELEESLAGFLERRSSVDMQRKSNETEIFRMQMDLQAAEEAYLFTEDRFNSALGASW